MNTTATLGELISLFYDEYLTMYGDSELASVATAASINELLIRDDEAANTRGDPVPMEAADAA